MTLLSFSSISDSFNWTTISVQPWIFVSPKKIVLTLTTLTHFNGCEGQRGFSTPLFHRIFDVCMSFLDRSTVHACRVHVKGIKQVDYWFQKWQHHCNRVDREVQIWNIVPLFSSRINPTRTISNLTCHYGFLHDHPIDDHSSFPSINWFNWFLWCSSTLKNDGPSFWCCIEDLQEETVE